MFTDIVGYSRMMNEDQAGTLAFLKRHNQLLDKALRRYKGRLIKTIGDAYMVEFATPQAAVDCAVAIQRGLEEAEDGKRRVRIGLHAGEVVDKKGDIFGETVNIAARLEPLAPHGGLCISQKTIEQLELPKGCITEDAGPTALKNISQTIPLIRVFPTRASHVKVLQHRRRLAQRRWFKRIAAAGAMLALAWLGWRSRPAMAEAWEMRHWKPQDHLGFDTPQQRARWSESHSTTTEYSRDGLVPGRVVTYGLEAYPAQPFTVKVGFRVLDPGNRASLEFDLADRFVETTRGAADGAQVPASNWRGLGLQVEIKGHEAELVTAEIDAPKFKLLQESDSDMPRPQGWHELTVRFDKELWSVAVDDGKALVSYVPPPTRGKPFRIGFTGWNMVVRSVDVYGRKIDQDLDLASAANTLSMEHRDADAQVLYDVLARVADNDTDKGRFLLRSGDLYAQSGDREAAQRKYDALLALPHSNIYKGYYELSQAERGFERARAAGALSGSAEALPVARLAAALLRRFIDENPGHSRENYALFMLAQLDAGALHDASAAEVETRLLIGRRDPNYSGPALTLLLKSILTPQRLAADETLDYLRSLEKGGGLPLWYLEDLRSSHLTVLAARGDYAAYGRLLWDSVVGDVFGNGSLRSVFKELRELSWTTRFREQMDDWTAALEADPAQAIQFYKYFLRNLGLDLCWPIQNFRQDSPITGHAAEYLARGLDYRRGTQPPAESLTVFKPDAKGKNFSAVGTLFSSLTVDTVGHLNGSFETGNWYGTELVLLPGGLPLKKDGSCDLRGYDALRLRLRLDQGMRWALALAESGVASPNSASHDGLDGADGEQYVFPFQTASGAWEDVTIHFSDLQPKLWWGNQAGNRVLDLQSVNSINILLPQKQGKGHLSIERVEAIR